MTDDDQFAPYNRLYGMMQHLMVYAANGRKVEEGPRRDVVTTGDALDACLILASVIDEVTQEGRIPQERGLMAAALLMMVRDYIKPLPTDLGPDGSDPVAPDLTRVAADLREQMAGGDMMG